MSADRIELGNGFNRTNGHCPRPEVNRGMSVALSNPGMRSLLGNEAIHMYEASLRDLGCSDEDAKRNADQLRRETDVVSRKIDAIYASKRAALRLGSRGSSNDQLSTQE